MEEIFVKQSCYFQEILRNIFPNYKAVESHDSPSKNDTDVFPEQKASSTFTVVHCFGVHKKWANSVLSELEEW